MQLSRILGWKGADTCTSVTLYSTVIQATIFFVPDIWVMTLRIRRTLVIFNQRVSCCYAGIHLKGGTSRSWEYPYLEEVMATVGLEEMDTYDLRL